MSTTLAQHEITTIDKLDLHLGTAWRARRSIFFLSHPGIGKTQKMAAFARKKSATLFKMIASQLDRIDLTGIPSVQEKKIGGTTCKVTAFSPMQVMAEVSKEMNPDGGPAILYFNEVNNAPDSVQAVLLRLFEEREIGDLSLRDNVLIVADGNPSSSMSIGRDVPQAMRRRFKWVCIEADLAVWKRWAATAEVDARVLAFFEIPAFLTHFCNFDPKARERLTFACPATWEALSDTLKAIEAEVQEFGTEFEKADLLVAYTGEVGMSAGVAFHGFMKHAASIPDAKAVLENPDKAKLPDDLEMRYLLVGSLINMVRSQPKLVPGVMTVAKRLFDDKDANSPEHAVFLVRTLVQIPSLSKAVQNSAAFCEMRNMLMKDGELLQALGAVPQKKKVA